MWSFWSYAPETVPLRAAAAFALALVLSLLTGGRLIAFLKGHERGGQPIRGDGPKSHIEEKKGTPTMGGLLILGTSLLAMLLFANVKQHFVWISMLVLFIYGLTGFADDYVKVKKQTPNAMTAKMKLFIQFMAAVLAVNVIAAATPNSIESRLYLPYIDWSFQLSWVYIPFAVIVISGASNAVNLSDGLDGLAAGMLAVVFRYLWCLRLQPGIRRLTKRRFRMCPKARKWRSSARRWPAGASGFCGLTSKRHACLWAIRGRWRWARCWA